MTALVTCAEQLASLTAALAAASPAQLSALGSAMGLHPGVSAPATLATGAPVPQGSFVNFASIVVAQAGKVAISALGSIRQTTANTNPGDTYVTGVVIERVRAGVTTRVAASSDATFTGNNEATLVAPNAVRNYLDVQAGDVFNASVFWFGAAGGDYTPWTFQGSSGDECGLFMHYVR